jgi:hypothetical protein
MNNNIDKLVQDALNSADGAGRAAARPYLFTRLSAKMQRRQNSRWDAAVSFITRPAVVVAGLCLVAVINIMAVMISDDGTATVADEQAATAEDYSNSVAVLYDIDSNEP